MKQRRLPEFDYPDAESDRQWRDFAAIVRVQGERLDRAYPRDAAPLLGVADLLERALD
jgi:hypothetical protein